MRPLRLRAVLIGTGVTLALGWGGSAASAASGHPVAPAKGSAASATRARADAQGGTWGQAEEVPGTAALNKAGGAQVNSVSCAPAGNCSAGGYYTDGSDHGQAFVVSQT